MQQEQSTATKIRCHFDGVCEPVNPGGYMGMGGCIALDGQQIWTYSDMQAEARTNSNNVAEYLAFIAVVRELQQFLTKEHGFDIYRVDVRGDSRLVVNQVNGKWKMRGGYYMEHAVMALVEWNNLMMICTAQDILLTLQWIPRAQNELADVFSKQKLIEAGVTFKIQPQ